MLQSTSLSSRLMRPLPPQRAHVRQLSGGGGTSASSSGYLSLAWDSSAARRQMSSTSTGSCGSLGEKLIKSPSGRTPYQRSSSPGDNGRRLSSRAAGFNSSRSNSRIRSRMRSRVRTAIDGDCGSGAPMILIGSSSFMILIYAADEKDLKTLGPQMNTG